MGIDVNVSPHWLRHSHASHSLDKGAPLSLVKETLGHSSIAITEKYLHAKPDDSSRNVSVLVVWGKRSHLWS